jgi:hypothetical protein
LRLLRVCFIKRSVKSLRQLDGVIVGPEVHEVEMWLIVEHVIVHGLDFNPVRPQSTDYWVDFVGEQDKIS